jgi:glycosyltransferase involved in cell wall biosynthesis
VPDVRVRYFRYPVFPIATRPFNGPICARYLEPLLQESRPDVILNYRIYPEGYAAVALGRKLGVPTIVTATGSDLNRIPDPITRTMTRSTLRGATVVATVSEHLRGQALRMGVDPLRALTIHNGCDNDIFCCASRDDARRRLGIPKGQELILFVGRIDVQKGVTELVESCLALAEERPRLQLILVGEGPAKDQIEMVAAHSAYAEKVKIIPPCSTADVAQWMTAADVFTLPSYAEGCPNAVVEALNCGRPVVATNVGGIPELVDENNGVLVNARDPADLRQGLEKALSRKWNAEDISRASQRSWARVAEETYQTCQWAIESSTQAEIGGNVQPSLRQRCDSSVGLAGKRE